MKVILNVSLIGLQTIVKLKLIAPILDILFPIVCDLSSDEEEDADVADADAQNPSSCALQVTYRLFALTKLAFMLNKSLHNGFLV